MIVRGNQKLGPALWSWNLPVVKTCPGASPLCLELCYAQRAHFLLQNVQDAHWHNLEIAEDKDFVSWMTSTLRHNMVQVLRVHCSGDFYSVEYVRRWCEIVRRSPRTTFFAYTRSWRTKRLQKDLRRLARMRNFQMWLSFDRSMLPPPKWKGCLSCYMSEDDNDLPRRQVDLVFRDRPKSVMKYTPNDSLVCPYEQGTKPQQRFSCSTCRICFIDKLVQIGTPCTNNRGKQLTGTSKRS